MAGQAGPVVTIVLAIFVVWYLACIPMNTNSVERTVTDAASLGFVDRFIASINQPQPALAAPHQIVGEIGRTVLFESPLSRRSLIYHCLITLASTLSGFIFGTLLGIGLAILIVHMRSLRKSLLPWIIVSQTIPILAIAPMVVIVLGKLDLPIIVPKALIAAYLCFFPVAISMVKGLTSPDPMQLDLMRTYNASTAQTLWKLRWPASTPFLFASLKVAVAASLVGAIVAEMPTGAQGGLGSRLLTGFQFSQDLQVWAALFAGAILASGLIALMAAIERHALRVMGARP
jgi:NitT/TauT family transport system permease protein